MARSEPRREPGRSPRLGRQVNSLCRELTRELVREGARAVVLIGSWTRSEPHDGSDVDLLAIGRERPHRMLVRDGFLVSQDWFSLARCRREFLDPGTVGASVPAWRDALIFHDPKGIARRFQQQARVWDWEKLGKRTDRWVARSVADLAEKVGKMVGMARGGNHRAAAINAGLLAARMGYVLSVHRRVLYGSENELWDRISEGSPEAWRTAQDAALGLSQGSRSETIRAAGGLYRMTAAEVAAILNAEERTAVDWALHLLSRA